jgi:hypothetical protein
MSIKLIVIVISIFQILGVHPVFGQTNMTNQNETTGIVNGDNLLQNVPIPIDVVIIALAGPAMAALIGALIKRHSDNKIEQLKQDHDRRLKDIEQRYRLESEYDLDLRIKRIEAYKQLWSEQYLLRKHSKPDKIMHMELEDLKRRLTVWYYEVGGIFLTETSQKIYETFIIELEKITCKALSCKEMYAYKHEWETIDPKDGDFLRDLASAFRTNLCKDIGTREESKNPSLYNDLQISIIKKPDNKGNLFKIKVKNKGNKSLAVPDGILGLEIRSLVDNDNYKLLQIKIDKLDPDEETEEIEWTPPTNGNYIFRTAMQGISSVRKFEVVDS